jgi:hypothetical protein
MKEEPSVAGALVFDLERSQLHVSILPQDEYYGKKRFFDPQTGTQVPVTRIMVNWLTKSL